MTTRDPQRWFELRGSSAGADADVSSGLRCELSALQPAALALRTSGPTPAQVARMRSVLGLAPRGPEQESIGAASPGVVAARNASSVLRIEGLRMLRWLGVLALVGSGAAVGWHAANAGPRSARDGQPTLDRSVPTDFRRTPAAPRVEATTTDDRLPTAGPELAIGRESPQSDSVEARRAPRPRPQSTSRARGEIVRRSTDNIEAPAQTQTSEDLPAELALLKRARSRTRSEPNEALAIIREHEQRFPNGAFAQEREVLAIEALLAQGARNEAESRARQFFLHFAASPHARRVKALLER